MLECEVDETESVPATNRSRTQTAAAAVTGPYDPLSATCDSSSPRDSGHREPRIRRAAGLAPCVPPPARSICLARDGCGRAIVGALLFDQLAPRYLSMASNHRKETAGGDGFWLVGRPGANGHPHRVGGTARTFF